MSHDLDLGLRHEDERSPRSARLRRRRLVVLLVLFVALLGVAAAVLAGVGAVARLVGPPADYSGSGSGSVVVQIRVGDTLTDIGQTLKDDGVVKSVDAFTSAASANNRGLLVQPGYYRLREHMKASLALALLLNPNSVESSRVVIPEGTPPHRALVLVSTGARIPLEQLTALLAHPTGVRVPAECGGGLAGCLFPATYLFPPGTTAAQAVQTMVNRFAQAAQAVGLDAGAAALHRSPYQVLIVASIIEREAKLPGDYPKVAEVVYNRLRQGMPLQLDSTATYAREISSPAYDTYHHPGLPPGPISNPGQVALQAALHPTPGPWLYFVTIDKAGHDAFASTLAQQEANAALARKAGVIP